MNDAPLALLVAAVAIAALMIVTWAVSVVRRDASIVDIVWGLGFVVVAWGVLATTDGNRTRRILLVAMATIWGLRLATHLFVRNRGKGEDYRYQAMRRRYGERFAVVSLYLVFGLQGVLMWIVSLPLQLGQTRAAPDVGVIAGIGIAVWAVGMFFEDACVWWGIALVAAETGIGAIGLVGAFVMTVLLRRVSGVTLLERSLVKRRPGYEDYVERTSPFLPRRPRG